VRNRCSRVVNACTPPLGHVPTFRCTPSRQPRGRVSTTVEQERASERGWGATLVTEQGAAGAAAFSATANVSGAEREEQGGHRNRAAEHRPRSVRR
jgi:hypothetical protein